MLDRPTKILLALIALALWGIALRPLLAPAPARAQTAAAKPARDNAELKRLCDEDQADRSPPQGKSIDWVAVGPRDKARLKRVKEIYALNLLQTANDYDCAAIILQHGDAPEDFLLAHELWVVAVIKGKTDKDTLSLVAASEDRFLMHIGRPQRFGTQLRSEGGGPLVLYQVDPGVADEHRRLMIGHTLAEIKARVVELNKK